MQVIYVLNTKNDEHESFVARLKATHVSEVDVILSDCSQKLSKCKEQLTVRSEKQLISLNDELSLTREARDKLQNEQVRGL